MVELWKLHYRVIGKLAFWNYQHLQVKQIKMANLMGSLVLARHPSPIYTFWMYRLNFCRYIKINILSEYTKIFNKHSSTYIAIIVYYIHIFYIQVLVKETWRRRFPVKMVEYINCAYLLS